METKFKHALFSAITKLLRPLVRILLRNGVPFGTFADLAKWIYVDVAMKEFGIQGRKQTDSRVSIITGLSRKEVRRQKRLEQLSDAKAIDRYNRAARVISGWIRDKRFTDAKGNPRALNFEKGKVNFNDLVKSFSGDVPARAVLDELISVGAVEVQEDDKIKLLSRAYIPLSDEPEFLSILGTDVAHLVKTIDHNMIAKDRQSFFQRKVSYDNLPIEAMPQLRRMSAGQAQKLLERMDRWLSAHDRDANPAAKGRGRMRAGVGIYYFEEDWEKEHPGSE